MRTSVVLLLSSLVLGPSIAAALPLGEPPLVLSCDEPLSGVIEAASIVVPAGCGSFDGDLTLLATRSIQIAGQLRGSGPWSLRLESLGSVTITGNVMTGDGVSATPVIAAAEASGARGGDAGSITIVWGPAGIFTLADGALIRTGSGGSGGDVTLIPTEQTPTTGTLRGGGGGDAGVLALHGQAMFLYGTFLLGEGGRGGVAAIPSSYAGGEWTLAGGDGGHAIVDASVATILAFDVATGPKIHGARGGVGGFAWAVACNAIGRGGDGGAGWIGGDGGAAFADASACAVPSGATATGGTGGEGIIKGGDGGDAFALAPRHAAPQAAGGDGGCGRLGGSSEGGDAHAPQGETTDGASGGACVAS